MLHRMAEPIAFFVKEGPERFGDLVVRQRAQGLCIGLVDELLDQSPKGEVTVRQFGILSQSRDFFPLPMLKLRPTGPASYRGKRSMSSAARISSAVRDLGTSSGASPSSLLDTSAISRLDFRNVCQLWASGLRRSRARNVAQPNRGRD